MSEVRSQRVRFAPVIAQKILSNSAQCGVFPGSVQTEGDPHDPLLRLYKMQSAVYGSYSGVRGNNRVVAFHPVRCYPFVRWSWRSCWPRASCMITHVSLMLLLIILLQCLDMQMRTEPPHDIPTVLRWFSGYPGVEKGDLQKVAVIVAYNRLNNMKYPEK